MSLEYAEGAEKANIGVRPLGRGPIVSQVVLAEIALQKKLVRDTLAILPINTPEKAAAYRRVLAGNMPNVIPVFREFRLSF
jgi:hypothetical protein